MLNDEKMAVPGKHFPIRQYAISVLTKIGEAANGQLKTSLKSEDELIRKGAEQAVKAIKAIADSRKAKQKCG